MADSEQRLAGGQFQVSAGESGPAGVARIDTGETAAYPCVCATGIGDGYGEGPCPGQFGRETKAPAAAIEKSIDVPIAGVGSREGRVEVDAVVSRVGVEEFRRNNVCQRDVQFQLAVPWRLQRIDRRVDGDVTDRDRAPLIELDMQFAGAEDHVDAGRADILGERRKSGLQVAGGALKRYADWAMGIGVLGLLVTLITPISPFVLDLLLATNITISILLLMAQMTSKTRDTILCHLT